ncbi:MAG TPA: methyltransferase [Sphingobacteriaceae bacterium]|nr:methyltransferase [Sphingobacteriaceae bacterium]
MSNTIFQFKQFSVDQKGSAMKINTDGVLLAAKATSIAPKYILDIGTGTGVIALMLAQRFPESEVHALEINTSAAECAEKNFKDSPFAKRMSLYATDFNQFIPQVEYDLIVSNPPFFINSLKNPDENKTMARHVQEEFFDNLFSKTHAWLRGTGTFQLIWPRLIKDLSLERGFLSEWTIEKETDIRSFEDSEAIRIITVLSKQEVGNISKNEFVIYREKGKYTTEYLNLLKPFFLNF